MHMHAHNVYSLLPQLSQPDEGFLSRCWIRLLPSMQCFESGCATANAPGPFHTKHACSCACSLSHTHTKASLVMRAAVRINLLNQKTTFDSSGQQDCRCLHVRARSCGLWRVSLASCWRGFRERDPVGVYFWSHTETKKDEEIATLTKKKCAMRYWKKDKHWKKRKLEKKTNEESTSLAFCLLYKGQRHRGTKCQRKETLWPLRLIVRNERH